MALILPTMPGITWPRDVSFGMFDTGIQTSVSGKVTTYANKINPTHRYTINISGLDSTGNNAGLGNNSLNTLQGFFSQCYGRLLPFQYNDADDTSSAIQQNFGTGDGVTKAFQLVRLRGGFVEQVFAPTGTPLIYKGGVLQTVTTNYTIDLNLGIVTFVVAPGNATAVTWTGTYNWWCRFDADTLDTSNFMSGYYEAQKLSFTTVLF